MASFPPAPAHMGQQLPHLYLPWGLKVFADVANLIMVKQAKGDKRHAEIMPPILKNIYCLGLAPDIQNQPAPYIWNLQTEVATFSFMMATAAQQGLFSLCDQDYQSKTAGE